MTGLCLLCVIALSAACARLVDSVGPVVRCETCDAGALVQCKPLPRDCAERVREPGCGCCMTCALTEGQPCGIYTARCGAKLTCQQRPGESKPLQALLEGRGVCAGAPDKKITVLLPPDLHGHPEEEHLSNSTVATVTRAVEVMQRTVTVSGVDTVSQTRTGLDPKGSLLHTKLGVIQKEESKKSQSYRVESVSSSVLIDVHNFSLESKRETEYGPCRREMESVLKTFKISNVLNPRGFSIPNCDRKGFYKKKQCRPSKGRRRGICWCVDKYGQPLPGYEDKKPAHLHQCFNLEKE